MHNYVCVCSLKPCILLFNKMLKKSFFSLLPINNNNLLVFTLSGPDDFYKNIW